MWTDLSRKTMTQHCAPQNGLSELLSQCLNAIHAFDVRQLTAMHASRLMQCCESCLELTTIA